jgi:hypothetical protein
VRDVVGLNVLADAHPSVIRYQRGVASPWLPREQSVSIRTLKNGRVPNPKEGRSGVIRCPGTIFESGRATQR